MDGILLVDKPIGWTSFDVVAKVRGEIKRQTGLKKPKVGHSGTLDPLASGLLVLLIGSYCKRASDFTKLDKIYQVSVKLGFTSKTGDEEGEKVQINSREPSKSEIEEVVSRFMGDIMQTPHIFSAIKVNGQRAYNLARAGADVKLEPRHVTIYEVSNLQYKYPELHFTVKVSSGTYIRSLVEDIGKDLATGAYMTSLRRLKVGNFDIKKAVSIDDIKGSVKPILL